MSQAPAEDHAAFEDLAHRLLALDRQRTRDEDRPRLFLRRLPEKLS